MKVRIASLRMRLLVQLLPVVLMAVGLVAYVSIANATDNARQASFNHVAGLAQENANGFNASVEDGQAVGRTLAAIGESHLGGSREQVNRVVKRTFERNPGLIGAYIGYVPNGFDGADARFRGTPGADGKGRFGPYWTRSPATWSSTRSSTRRPATTGTSRRRPARTRSWSPTSRRAPC